MPEISESDATSPTLVSSPPLQGERVAFTGTLASMTHATAADLVREHGGEATEHVSRQTTMLVVGEEGWPLEDNGQPSVKLRQVSEWNEQGLEIRVVVESDFLHLIGLSERRDEVRQMYTPAMLSTLLEVEVHVIRGWARAGLIRPVRTVYRLPYFDFAEVNSARRLSQLLESGVTRREIEDSLKHLPAVIQRSERPLEQLEILAQGRRVVVRDAQGLVSPRTGQRLLDFEPPLDDATHDETDEVREPCVPFQREERSDTTSARDWSAEGCRLYEAGRIADAIEALRLSLMAEPANPEVHFHLAECLYRQQHLRASLERYFVAIELDHDYLEAWTQIGCLHRELEELEAAVNAFEIALEIHEDYPDAHFQLAEALHESQRCDEARAHWQRYLGLNARGPWADLARQRLGEQGDRSLHAAPVHPEDSGP